MWTVNFQMFKLDLEKVEEREIKLPTSVRSLKKQESSRETSTSALLTMPKPLTMWSQQTVENSSRDGNISTPEICMQVKKQQSELHTEQQTGSNLGKEYVKTVYYHLDYLT